MTTFNDLKIGDDVYRLDKDIVLVILKVNNMTYYENGTIGFDLVSEDGMSSVEIDIRPYYVDHTEYHYYVNSDDYWFYSDSVACSHAITEHVEYLSDMIAELNNIKDQLIRC